MTTMQAIYAAWNEALAANTAMSEAESKLSCRCWRRELGHGTESSGYAGELR